MLHVVPYPDAQFVRAAQGCVLWNLVRRHESTAFGIAHNFVEIETTEDFQRWVPLQSHQKPSFELRLGEHLCVTPRSTARVQLGALVDIITTTSKWLDLEYCVRQWGGQSGESHAREESAEAVALMQRFRSQPVEVVVVPAKWLGPVVELLGRWGHSASFGDQAMRSTLRLIIATHCDSESHIGDLRDALGRICPAVTLLAAYQTPDGIIAGIETSPGSEHYRMLVSAGVYFEFACPDAGGGLGRIGLERAAEGKVYELCVSTKRGLFAYRTGLRVVIAQPPKRQVDDANLKRQPSWHSKSELASISAGALFTLPERVSRKTFFC